MNNKETKCEKCGKIIKSIHELGLVISDSSDYPIICMECFDKQLDV